MIVTVTGIGIWTRGVRSWDEFRQGVADGFTAMADDFEPPRPEAIPARERRRSGLTINLAVEVMHQACDMAGVDKTAIASVFASAMGDTDVTDYMCRKLATSEKLLSPTKFHNSVHNAPSGYWSISAVNRQPSSFVGGFRDSFACGLLEAATCAVAEMLPVGFAAYDVANRAPFGDVLPIDESLGLALLMLPGEHPDGWCMALDVVAGTEPTSTAQHPALRRLADANPIGVGLPLLEALAGAGSEAPLHWPLGSGASLRLQIRAPRATP